MVDWITVYQASDGKRFDDLHDAENYEYIYQRCQEILGELRPNETKGKTMAVRQHVYAVKSAFRKLMELCCDVLYKHKRVFRGVANGQYHRSHAARILSDYSNDYPCLQKAFFRFECINMESGLEYNQPYFVEHEDEWRYPINEMTEGEKAAYAKRYPYLLPIPETGDHQSEEITD